MNNSTILDPCYQRSLQGKPTKELYRLIFLPLLALSVFGNIANIIVYRHPFLKSSTTVRMLSFKAVMNMLTVMCMAPSFLYFYLYNNEENHQPFLEADHIPWFYWHGLKYTMFGSNWFSTVAVWLTVVVTLEHYMLVGFPHQAKAWSTMRNANLTFIVSTILSVVLHSLNLIAYRTITFTCKESNTTTTSATYLFVPTKLPNLITYLQIYFWVHSLSVQILPMVLLVSFSWLIYDKLFRGQKFTTNSEQRQTVVRLALATTACHIIFEMPHVVVMVLAAVVGSHQGAWPLQPEITAAAMFLGFTNASVTFLVYLGGSKKFRHIAVRMCCPKYCMLKLLTEEELTGLGSTSRTTVRKSTKCVEQKSVGAKGMSSSLVESQEAVELLPSDRMADEQL